MMGCTCIFIEHLINYHTLPIRVLQSYLTCNCDIFMIKMINSLLDQELMYQIMYPSLLNFKPSFRTEHIINLMAVQLL